MIRIIVRTFILFILFSTQFVYSQILVSGTSFEPKTVDPTKKYYGIEEVKQYGFQEASLTSLIPLTPSVDENVFHTTQYYGITNNPNKLDTLRYNDVAGNEDYQLVFSPKSGGANTTILVYTVENLVPNSQVSVVIDYCNAIAPNYCPFSLGIFKVAINAEVFNLTNGQDVRQVGIGKCATDTIKGIVNKQGRLEVRINSLNTSDCSVVGINKIEVVGFPEPQVFSKKETEVCVGEQIALHTVLNYNATYQWQVNSAGSWSNIANGTNPALLYELSTTQSYQFRVQLTPINGSSAVVSTPTTINSIVCCEINGAPASRQTIFLDDFGRIDMSDPTGGTYIEWDYSDILNPIEVTKTTTTPFRWKLNPQPYPDLAPNTAQFQASGALVDGTYTVAGLITGFNSYTINGVTYKGARLEWASRITGPVQPSSNEPSGLDHSGKPDGAAFLINNPPNAGGEVIYRKTIDNLCFGKQLYFETWITVFTDVAPGSYNPVQVTLKATDSQDLSNTTLVTSTATREADGGGVWVKLAGNITLTAANSVLVFEIINNVNTDQNGNDLVIDDIKISICAPPSVNMFVDLKTLSQSEAVCTDPFTIQASATSLLSTFFGNNEKYLFQWTLTPSDNFSWTNYGTPQASEFLTIDPKTSIAFIGLTKGDKVYFRTIVASASIFSSNNDFVPSNANIHDPCRNYSVSEPIVVTANCNCILSPEIVGDFDYCAQNEHTLITVDNDYDTYKWSSGGTEKEEIVTYLDNPITLSVTKNNCVGTSKSITVNESVCTGIQDQVVTGISVYPNPVGGRSLSFSQELHTVLIFNSYGQEILSQEVVKELNVESLPTGIYYLKSKEGNINFQIVR